MVIDADLIAIVVNITMFLLGVGGVVFTVIRWVVKQNKQAEELSALKKLYEQDINRLQEQAARQNQVLQDELQVLSDVTLTSLNRLQQCYGNPEVTAAHQKLKTYLNQKAHGQQTHGNQTL